MILMNPQNDLVVRLEAAQSMTKAGEKTIAERG
jgi:hypothetical protein